MSLESLTNNKLFAGLVVLALSLALLGMKQSAATDVRVDQAVTAQLDLAGKIERLREEAKGLSELRESVARLEERQKQDAQQIDGLRADVKEILRRVR